MEKMNGYLGMVLNMMMMSETNFSREDKPKKFNSSKPPKPIIPKGCKEYHFTRTGHFDTTENMWNDIDYIFTCIASSDKNAIKKFEKFESMQ
jgi:hypothetical protein